MSVKPSHRTRHGALVNSINVLSGEGSDQDQGILPPENKSIQEAASQLPNPPECNAEVHLFPDKSFRINKKNPFLSMPSFRFKFYFRFLQSVNREVAREVRKIKSEHRSIFKIRS